MGDIRALLKIKCLVNIVPSIQSGFLDERTWTLHFRNTHPLNCPNDINNGHRRHGFLHSIINFKMDNKWTNKIRARTLSRIALPDWTDCRCSVRDRYFAMKSKIIKIAMARCHEKFKIPRLFRCPLTFYLTRGPTKPRNSSPRCNIFLQEDLRSFALFSGASLSRLFMLQRGMTREKRHLVLAINNNGSRRSMCLASDTAAFCLLQHSLLREIASIVSRM